MRLTNDSAPLGLSRAEFCPAASHKRARRALIAGAAYPEAAEITVGENPSQRERVPLPGG